jgi:outer membrane protein TolC
MPTRLHTAVAASVLVTWLGGTLFAQEPQRRVTPLRSLMERLEANNPEVLAAQYRFEAATKRPSQVSTLPDPTLTLTNVGVGQPFSRLNRSDFAYRAIGISQELPFPGKLALARDEARMEADSEREMYRAVVLEKTAQLKVAYFDWSGVTKAIEVTTKNRDLLDRLEQIARARYSVGRGIQQDVLRAQAEISGLAQRLELLDQRKAVIEARIRSVLNDELPLGRPADIRPSPLELDLQRILALLEESSPRLKASEALVQSRAVGIDRARRDLRPDFNVGFQWQKTGSQFPDYYMATVEIRLPIFSSRKQQLGIEESAARFQESRHNFEAARQELVFQAKDFYLTAKTSERLLALFQSGIIPQTSLSLESALAGYEVGNVDFLTLMSNAMSLLDYEMQYYEEVAKHEQALAQLEPLLNMELTQPQP